MAKSGKSPAAGKGTGKHKRAAESAEDSQDETGSQEASGDDSEEAEPSPKSSKRASGKQKVSGKTSGSFKKSTGRMKSVGPKLSGHELIPVVCSECYEELTYDTGSTATEIVCPVCEHSAGKPQDADLHHIADKRRGEKKSFITVFAIWFVGALGWGSWAVLAQNPVHAADNGMFWGPAGVGILAFLIVMILVFKYENNRWETYF
jgi:hypothetical protein